MRFWQKNCDSNQLEKSWRSLSGVCLTFVENFKSYFPRTKPCILLLFPCWPIFMQSYTQLMKFSSSLETSRDGKLRMSAFTSSNPTQCNGSTCKISNLCAGFQNVHKKICIFVVQRQNQFFYFFQRKYNLLGYCDLFPIDGGKLKEQPTHSIIPTTPHSACNLLLSVMVGVQGTILRRGAMHHSSHTQSQSQTPCNGHGLARKITRVKTTEVEFTLNKSKDDLHLPWHTATQTIRNN